jgi:HK97 family phage major capsid protein
MDLTKLRGPQRRELPMGMQVEDKTDETLTFSFSSEVPVERFFGREILLHEEGAMDISRLNDGAPWLWGHDPNKVLGVVEKAWLGDDRRLYSTVRWSPNTTERGTEEWKRRADIEAGIVRNVSFAYSIDDLEERSGDFYVTKWRALEVSSVSVPADQTVGLGRAMDDPWVEPDAKAVEPEPDSAPAADPEPNQKQELPSLNTEQTAERTETSDDSPMTTETINVEELQSGARRAERERVAAIRGMCSEFKLGEDLAERLINDDSSVDAARAVVMKELGMRKVEFQGRVHDAGAAEIGLSEREVKRYSFLRVAAYLADPNPRTAEAAAFELEVGRAAQAKHSRSASGVLVPWEVLNANRASTPSQVVGTFGDGGALVGTDRLDAQFIDLIRNRSAFLNTGLTMLSGLDGNVEIPKKLTSSQYYFVGENQDVTNSKLTFGLVNMIPRTIGVRVPISRRMMIQASPDIENLVRLDMAESVALGMDYTIGYGTGNNGQPLGIINNTGLGSVLFAGGASKKFPASVGGDGSTDLKCGDWGEYVDLETAIAVNNLDVSSMRYVMNSVMRGALKQTLRASAAGSDYVLTDAGQINGYPTVISNQMQQNDVLFGNFADCVVGMWSGLDVVIDPYTQSASGQVILTVHQDFDVALRRPQSFALGT